MTFGKFQTRTCTHTCVHVHYYPGDREGTELTRMSDVHDY